MVTHSASKHKKVEINRDTDLKHISHESQIDDTISLNTKVREEAISVNSENLMKVKEPQKKRRFEYREKCFNNSDTKSDLSQEKKTTYEEMETCNTCSDLLKYKVKVTLRQHLDGTEWEEKETITTTKVKRGPTVTSMPDDDDIASDECSEEKKLEEIEREDNFRLKRFKELKIKKNKEKEGTIFTTCACQYLETGDSLQPPGMGFDKDKLENTQMEVPETVCCNTNMTNKKNNDLKMPEKQPITENTDEQRQNDIEYTNRDIRYILSTCNSTAMAQYEDPCVCVSSSTIDSGAKVDSKNNKYIFSSCQKISDYCRCESVNSKPFASPFTKSQEKISEFDTSCSCEKQGIPQIVEPVCSCEPQVKPQIGNPVCSCMSLKQPVCSCKPPVKPQITETTCSCESLKKLQVKEPKVSFANEKIQVENLKNSRQLSGSQHKRETFVPAKPDFDSVRDNQQEKRQNFCSCQQPVQSIVYVNNKITQTKDSTNSIQSCGMLQNFTPRPSLTKEDGLKKGNEYILSSYKTKSETNARTRSDLQAQGKVIEGAESRSSGRKSPIKRSTKQTQYEKSMTKNKSDTWKALRPRTKVSLQDKEVQTRSQCELPSKTIGCSATSCAQKFDEFKRTFKEIIKMMKEPVQGGNIRGEHNAKPVKKEMEIISNSCARKKSLKPVSRTSSTASAGSRNADQKKCSKESSALTISQSNSITSADLSRPVTERESLVREVNLNSGETCSKGSNKSVESSTINFKSCESTKSESSSYTGNVKNTNRETFTPASNSCKIKIVTKTDDEITKNENKVSLTPSTFNIIKQIIIGLSKTEASKETRELKQDQSTRITTCSYGLKDSIDNTKKSNSVCSYPSKIDNPSSCSCKYAILIPQNCKCSYHKEISDISTRESLSLCCNKPRSLPTIKSPSKCACARSVKEKPALIQTAIGQKQSQEYCYQKSKTSSEKLASKVEAKLSNCSCNEVTKAISGNRPYSCQFKNNIMEEKSNISKCEQEQSNGSLKEWEIHNGFCKSTRSMKSKSDSCHIYSKFSNHQSSGTHDENNSLHKKSLRFSDSITRNQSCSCSCLMKKLSNDSIESCLNLNKSTSCTKSESKNVLYSETQVDASTSTRRSDKYDVRPLKLLMDRKKVNYTCKSDTAIIKAYKKPNSCNPLNRSCSFNDDRRRKYQ
ncbi:jg17082 [Pararge aegeria aegeria]|uniref:Jg17082 protein n=1 Tax=Pararge aegeria aegeria TaxID=348720 RepID=A0A8S4R3M2_9NEOP|nr:jg17082 [Pararge aegeria aegeria]